MQVHVLLVDNPVDLHFAVSHLALHFNAGSLIFTLSRLLALHL